MSPDLVYTIDEYADQLDSSHFHFCLSSEIGFKRPVRGFGSDSNKQRAMEKAVSEFIERHRYFELNREGIIETSNGLAAHPSRDCAVALAALELYERDAVLTHWIAKKSPHWLAEDFSDKSAASEVKSFNDALATHQISFQVGRLAQVLDASIYVSALCSLDGSFGFAFASAAGSDELSAVRSLISNQRRAINIILSRKRSQLPIFPYLLSADMHAPQDHREFYLNPAHANSCAWFFEQGSVSTCEPVEIEFEIFNSNFSDLPDRFVALAKTTRLQNYFTGMTERSKLNILRFSDLGFDIANNAWPHPLA